MLEYYRESMEQGDWKILFAIPVLLVIAKFLHWANVAMAPVYSKPAGITVWGIFYYFAYGMSVLVICTVIFHPIAGFRADKEEKKQAARESHANGILSSWRSSLVKEYFKGDQNYLNVERAARLFLEHVQINLVLGGNIEMLEAALVGAVNSATEDGKRIHTALWVCTYDRTIVLQLGEKEYKRGLYQVS